MNHLVNRLNKITSKLDKQITSEEIITMLEEDNQLREEVVKYLSKKGLVLTLDDLKDIYQQEKKKYQYK